MPFAPRQHQADPARPPERFFLKLMSWRSKYRQTEPSPAFCCRSSSRRRWISSSVRSGPLRTNSSSQSSCFFNGDRLWPPDRSGLKTPGFLPPLHQRIAVASPITNWRAAARAATPPSTTRITRTRRSFEYSSASAANALGAIKAASVGGPLLEIVEF
jgi:hypothetical protein